MNRFTIALAIVFPALLTTARFTATENSSEVALRLRSGVMAIVSLELNSDGRAIEQQVSESATAKGNILQLRISRQDGEPFELRGFTLRVRVSTRQLGGIWFPSAPSSSTSVMAGDGLTSLRGIADANQGIPY